MKKERPYTFPQIIMEVTKNTYLVGEHAHPRGHVDRFSTSMMIPGTVFCCFFSILHGVPSGARSGHQGLGGVAVMGFSAASGAVNDLTEVRGAWSFPLSFGRASRIFKSFAK